MGEGMVAPDRKTTLTMAWELNGAPLIEGYLGKDKSSAG